MEQPKRYRVEYNRNGCIGADICTFIDPDHFVMASDNKVDMIGGVEKDKPGVFVMEVEGNLDDMCNEIRRAADSCPAGVIRIIEIATGRRIAGHPEESEKFFAKEEIKK